MEEGETESVEIKRVNYQTAIRFHLYDYRVIHVCHIGCCSVYKSSLSYKSTDLTSTTKTNKKNKKKGQTTKDLPNEKKILGNWRMLWSLSFSVLNIHFQQQSYTYKKTNKQKFSVVGRLSRDDDAINILARTEIGLDDRIQVSKVETQKWFFLVCLCVCVCVPQLNGRKRLTHPLDTKDGETLKMFLWESASAMFGVALFTHRTQSPS